MIFSKFDMKSRFRQIQIHEKDKYKTAFATPFGQYEWNVMPFGLKNAPSEFQNIILSPLSQYSIFWKCLGLFSNTLNKSLFKHDVIIYEFWIITKIYIFQDKMTPPKFLSSTEKGKAKLTKLSKHADFHRKFKILSTLLQRRKGKLR